MLAEKRVEYEFDRKAKEEPTGEWSSISISVMRFSSARVKKVSKRSELSDGKYGGVGGSGIFFSPEQSLVLTCMVS